VSPTQLPEPGNPGVPRRTGFALPGGERLSASRRIREVFDHGQAFHGSRLVLFILFQSATERRFAVVAGRKIGGAVQRNRAKRRLREAYRHLRPDLPEGGFHLVLVARRGCDAASAAEVIAELNKLMARAFRGPGLPTAITA